MTKFYLSYLLQCVLYGVLYFIFGEVGLLIKTGIAGVTPFWPPSGLMLMVFLLVGTRYWPAVFLGIALLASNHGISFPVAMIAASGNAFEAIIAWFLLQKAGFELTFNTVKHVAYFSIIAFVAPLISSTLGSIAMMLEIGASWSEFGFIWAMWWLGDAIGILLILPLGLAWRYSVVKKIQALLPQTKLTLPKLAAQDYHLSTKNYMQFLAVISLLTLASYYSFIPHDLGITTQLASFYLIMPLTVIAAILWGQKGATLATAIVSSILLVAYHPYWDTFAIHDGHLNLLLVVTFIAITVITSLIVAALFSERQQAEHSLRQSHQQLKESELRLRQVSDNIKEVFWLADAKTGDVIYASPSYENIWETKVEALLEDSNNWTKPIHSDDVNEVVTSFEKLSKGTKFDYEYRIVQRDGSIRWIHDKGFPVYNESGELYRIAGIAEDITERKEAAENRKQQQEELARLSRYISVGELGTSLAHEISQPLTSIICYSRGALTRLASEKLSDTEIKDIMTCMSDEATRAGKIVKKLREFVNRKDIRFSTVDVNEVVEETIKLIEEKARSADVSLVSILSPTIPNIIADTILLQQVILNLSFNAIEAMQTAELKTRVLTISTNVNHNAVQLRVCDTGPGVEDELLEEIMKPLFTTKTGGIGLGLPISYSIIESMGGNLNAYSEPNRGFCFEISLPVQMTAS
ncbi:MAG: MASE1 domain-containing protein [Gammaproteobacteria bacterium]|nr:MASE1 domain-containing protein [Gammaproteobacteria bacterium]